VINFDLTRRNEGTFIASAVTARMGKAGEAIRLVTQEERVNLCRLERTLGNALDRENVEGFEKIEILAPKR